MSKKQDEKKLSEMEILTLGKEVTVRGETVTVRPYSWADTIRMVKHFGTIFKMLYIHSDSLTALLGSLEPLPEDASNDAKGARQSMQISSLISLMDGLDDIEDVLNAVTKMVAASTKLDEDYIRSLSIDEMLELGMAVFEINKDFFMNRAPRMRELLKSATGKNEKQAPTK